MLKRAMLALAFVGALVVGSLGLASSAEAYHGHCGGGGYSGGHYPQYRSHHGGYGPRYSAYYHRYGGRGGNRHHDHYYDHYNGPRSGVSFHIGF